MTKDYDANRSYPLALFIHDRGEVGTEPRISLIRALIGAKVGHKAGVYRQWA